MNSVSVTVSDVMNRMKQEGFKVMLSGSGSTFLVFGDNLSEPDVCGFLPEGYSCHSFEFVN